jgi:hypothetical protein
MCHLTDMGGKNNPVGKINALRTWETVGRRQVVSGQRATFAISAKSTTAGAEALTFCQAPAPSDPPPARRMARLGEEQRRRCAQDKYTNSLRRRYAARVLKLVLTESLHKVANQSVPSGVEREESTVKTDSSAPRRP